MKKRAFTLVEMLAVIVLLAIILAITVPSISGIISKATKNAFEADAKMIIKAIDLKKLENNSFDKTTLNIDNIDNLLKISNQNYEYIEVTEENGEPYITIVGKNKWNCLIAMGTYKDMTIIESCDGLVDNVPPVITIIGDNPLSINEGTNYNDPGATATDDRDGNITDNIMITSTVNPNIPGSYSVIYQVSDSGGNMVTETRIVYVLDISAPVISLLGDNPIEILPGSIYSDPGATALDEVDGDITSDIIVTSTVNPNVIGTYTVTYNVTDNAGNTAAPVVRTVNVIDNINPEVSFGTNGIVTYAQTSSTTVLVTDANSSIDENNLKYLWNTSTVSPIESDFTLTFTNEQMITSPAGVTGSYYLWILAKDIAGNTVIVRTNVFNLDNTAPVITILGSNPVSIEQGSVYSDAGATATDNIDGDITANITIISTVNPNIVGTYSVTYSVSDSVGNSASLVRTVNITSPPTLISMFSEAAGGPGWPDGTYYYRNGAYYFVGYNTYNWIEFGQVSSSDPTPLMWRIVKHNNEGIKIIYEGVKSGTSVSGDGRISIDGSYSVAFDISGSNNWDRPATLKTKLEEWYNNLYVVNKNNYVQPIQWCIGPGPFPGTDTMYQVLGYETSFMEFYNSQCTVKTAGTSVVGLIAPNDFMSASSNWCMSPGTCCNASYQSQCVHIDWRYNNYLFKGGYWYWTLNPSSSFTSGNVWIILYVYGLDWTAATTNKGYGSARPVLNLKTSVLYDGGDGTLSNPYKIKDQ